MSFVKKLFVDVCPPPPFFCYQDTDIFKKCFLNVGGGSALLPAPKPPLTLEEKKNLISLLFSKGATIEEINCVRKRLSSLKGGNLAELARPATVSCTSFSYFDFKCSATFFLI